MRPAAITLNYSVKDIRHDVQQIIYIIHIRIWKIAIEQTSVGLTHTRPNYCKFMYICVRNWDNYELCICDMRYIAIGKDSNKTSGRGCSGHWGRGTSQLMLTSLQISLAAICLVSVWLELAMTQAAWAGSKCFVFTKVAYPQVANYPVYRKGDEKVED